MRQKRIVLQIRVPERKKRRFQEALRRDGRTMSEVLVEKIDEVIKVNGKKIA